MKVDPSPKVLCRPRCRPPIISAEPPADRQAEPGAAVLARGRRVGLRECLEQLGRAARRSCRSRCRVTRNTTHSRPSPCSRATSSVMAPVLGELARVAQQVEQDLPHLGHVGAHLAELRGAARRSSVLPFFSTSGWTVVTTSSIIRRRRTSRGTAPSCRLRSSTGRGRR